MSSYDIWLEQPYDERGDEDAAWEAYGDRYGTAYIRQSVVADVVANSGLPTLDPAEREEFVRELDRAIAGLDPGRLAEWADNLGLPGSCSFEAYMAAKTERPS